jgi:ferredoxin-NADP reductase
MPISGDWDGDGVDTVGLYSQANGFFFVRNANAPGPADLVFGFGAGGTGIGPLVGD